MKIEEIGEPIRVLASFSGGKVDPLRFLWSGRTYRVEAINGRWIDRQGGACRLHYSIRSGDETYYIHLDTHEVQWWLDRLIVEG